MSSKRVSGVVYVGAKRKKIIEKYAIDIGFYGGSQVTTVNYFQCLLDKYGEKAKDEMIADLINNR